LRGRFLTEVQQALGSPHRALRARLRALSSSGRADGSLDVLDPAQHAFVLAAALEGALVQHEAAAAEAAPFCDPDAGAGALLLGLVAGVGPDLPETRDRYQPPF